MPHPAPLAALTEEAVLRVLRGLLADELRAGGRALSTLEAAAWPEDLDLAAEGLALDSLERLNFGAAVNQFFRLHETGIEDYLLVERRLPGWARVVRHALAEGTSGITFSSSGSTGAPVPHRHAAAALLAEAAFWAEHFHGRARIVSLVPAHHIFGFLFTALLPSLAGLPVLDARAMPPGHLAATLAGSDLVVGFPAGLASLLRSLGRLPEGIVVASSTAALPASTQLALLAAGASQVTEIYGSSETAGIGWRDVAGAGFRLLPRWRLDSAGPEPMLREAATGRLVPLPDRARATEDGTLLLEGRRDHAVQVGGMNVHPARVAQLLRTHPDVLAAAVRPDTTLAEPRLKAFVVPRDGADTALLEAALRRFCAERLSGPERPVRFSFGAALPTGALGKDSDWTAPEASSP
jgi:4-coumarate--CoA ligase